MRPSLPSTFVAGFLAICALVASSRIQAKESAPNQQPTAAPDTPTTAVTLDITGIEGKGQVQEMSARLQLIASLPYRLVDQNGRLRVRAGIFSDYSTAQQYAKLLQTGGFPDCRVMPYTSDESVIANLARDLPDATSSRSMRSGSETLQPKRRSDEVPEQALNPYGDHRQPTDEPSKLQHDSARQALVSDGWQLLELGRLELAQEKFEQASAEPALRSEALYGLANLAYRRRKYGEATQLLEKLAERHFRRHETLPLLTASLFHDGHYEHAAESADRIPDSAVRDHWLRLIRKKQVRNDLRGILENPRLRSDGAALTAALNRNSRALAECAEPDLFIRLGRDLLTLGQRSSAARLSQRILAACPRNRELRKGILQLLAAARPDTATLDAVNKEIAVPGAPYGVRKDLLQLRVQLLRARADRLANSGPEQKERAADIYRDILRTRPDDRTSLSALAWRDFEQGKYQDAAERFERLHRMDPADRSSRQGLVLCLTRSGQVDRAKSLASHPPDPELLLPVLSAQLSRLPPDSAELPGIAQEVMALDPGNMQALTALAWWHYHHGDFDASERSFRRLLTLRPGDPDVVNGLANALLRQDKLAEALRVTGTASSLTAELKATEASVFLREAELASRQGDNAAAERALRAASIRTGDDPTIDDWLGWTIYRQGDRQRATQFFQTLYTRRPSARTAEPVLDLLEESGDLESRNAFLETLEASRDEETHALSAERRFAAGDAIRAATVDRRAAAPYANADTPWFGSDFFYRERFGEVGTYRLHQIGTRLSYVQPAADGTLYGFSILPQDLSSGRASTGPSADPLWISNRMVVTPYFSAERRGDDGFRVALGTTPLGGPVNPMPIAEAQIQGHDWLVGLHQLPVNQTMLSYIGERTSDNPRHPWGRVLRSGFVASKTFAFDPGYWLTLNGRYDYYWGENVWANHAVDGTFSAGRSFFQDDGKWSLGVFVTNMHYSHNTNFFTYGHGGYYSPNWMIATGPTVSYELNPRSDYWLRADSSVNWFRTDDPSSPVFPLNGTQTSAARYPGNGHDGVGYFFQLQGRQLLTPHLDWGLDVRYLRSAAFSDWSLILGIRAFIEPHNSPWPLPETVPQVYAAP